MLAFKWTPETVFALTLPQFFALSFMLKRLRADETIDTGLRAYTAGKYARECARRLFDDRGTWFRRAPGLPPKTFTDEELAIANERLRQEKARWKKTRQFT